MMVRSHPVVVVTGAARGIGRATCEDLAARGASLAMIDVADEVEARAAALPNARGYQLDVADRAAYERALDQIEHEVGPPEVLVNNAGIMALCAFKDLDPEVARRVVEVNLFGALHGMQLVIPGMIARGGGHVINVSSAAAKWGIPGENVYVASKWALDGLGEVVGRELRPYGIRLTTVYMGPVAETDLSLGMKETRRVRFSQPAEVGEAIAGAIDHPRSEVWVPSQLGWMVKATQVMPRPLRETLQRLAGVTRIATDIDRALRDPYERRVFDAELPAANAPDGRPAAAN